MSKKYIFFRNWDGEKIEDGFFDYDEKDQELVDFYNKYAKRCTLDKASTIKNIFNEDNRLIGYFAIAMSSTKASLLYNKKRNVPFPYPTLLLGRLLFCKDCRGQGMGTKVIDYIVMLAQKLNEFAACRFIAVDSKPHVVGFYKEVGFQSMKAKKTTRFGRFLNFVRSLFLGKDDESTIPMLFDLNL